jgi:CDP-archaeol synthase
MPDVGAVARAVALLAVANSLPWMSARIFGVHCNWPLDFGLKLPDGARLLGEHKTIRGLVAGIVGCVIAAILIGLPWQLGMRFGALSLFADALTSSLKRRLGFAPGANLPLVDSLPEAAFPLLVFHVSLSLRTPGIVAAVIAFMLLHAFSATTETRIRRADELTNRL